MKGVLGVIVFLLFLVIAAGMYYYSTYNKLIKLKESVDAAWSDVDVQLKRRADLIPNLVNTVKGYAQHEKEIFEYVAKARANLLNAKTPRDEIRASNQLEGAIGRLLLIVEKYPELKANEEFTRLMDNLEGTENRIAVARKRYNDAVRVYNTTIKSFPKSIIASKMGFKPAVYFRVENPKEKEVPKVNFGNTTGLVFGVLVYA
ncbi:LemA family protein [Hippea maritima]|uniref:LemA family protein n=1 Tax=Hippea maritima (strain ATCC 700847 / DSM 10411 / MH2) TaxID=760142 RepID=F2LVF1_HIPMA|nr:LemA family protein [Hippea maritima]AEA33735.1 LemA family protein [Hippea maritima DSM 10411]